MRVSCNPIVSKHLHVTQAKHVAAKEMVGTCMARECHEPYALFHRTFTSTASVCVPGRYDHGGQRDPRSSAPHCCSATQHRNSATQAPPTVAARRDAATPQHRDNASRQAHGLHALERHSQSSLPRGPRRCCRTNVNCCLCWRHGATGFLANPCCRCRPINPSHADEQCHTHRRQMHRVASQALQILIRNLRDHGHPVQREVVGQELLGG